MWPEPYGRAETTAPSSANSRAIAMADDDAAAVASGRMAVVIECRLPVVRAGGNPDAARFGPGGEIGDGEPEHRYYNS